MLLPLRRRSESLLTILPDQSLTEEMADYFSDISKDFPPVDASLLDLVPPQADFVSEVSCLPTEQEVYSVLKAAKKTSSVPNDFPTPFLKEFLLFLAKPDGKRSMLLLTQKFSLLLPMAI